MTPNPSSNRPKALPATTDWRTTDADEVNRRRARAAEETFGITNLDARHPIFSNFRVKSASGMTYVVEIRDLRERQYACDCVDFRINGLGTCKHVEAVLIHLQARQRRPWRAAEKTGSRRWDVVPDLVGDTLRVVGTAEPRPGVLAEWFGADGRLLDGDPEAAALALREVSAGSCPALRVSQEVEPWLAQRRRAAESKELRRHYELQVQSGAWPAQETKVPLFPYQREGMLHLAFTERALLADEMGLGKTIQAIAACALLHRLGRAQRVLIVTPASLKTEWEEQIHRFTELPYQVVFGGKLRRLRAYAAPPFFTITNYEQMVMDALDVNEHLRPDVVVLDEAQRIKNWNTKTAQAVKRLRSRYAFVLTGTPIENRIDELHSLMDFLNPAVLGPLFRFNRDFYDFDERGRPIGYRQLDVLHARIRPFLLRRRKAEVETELPPRTQRNHFVPLGDRQKQNYSAHEAQVVRLMNIALRRQLTPQEQEKLQRELAMMRMICDSNYILDPEDRHCPKLAELERLLEDCRENDAKVIVFSEWERMLHLVRDLCERLRLGFAWHTGTVPQKRRRAEINAFKSDPACRVFLSTDSGATGLNLQQASVVVNCDLPWNPARLEQRIARAWRKHQTQPVTVVNLIAEDTLEHRMLNTLAIKQSVAESVLDYPGRVTEIKIRSGRQALLERLRQLVTPITPAPSASAPPPSAKPPRSPDPAVAFAQAAAELLGGALVRCEERYPTEGPHSVLWVVVDRDPQSWQDRLARLQEEVFAAGKIDPLAPTRLEVLDRATDEAIQRLVAAGLLAPQTRACRALEIVPPHPVVLSAEDRAKATAYRAQAARRLKLARVLADGEFLEEARTPLRDALFEWARAQAVESGVPEPATVDDLVRMPWARLWQDAITQLREYLTDPAQPPQAIVEWLQRQLKQP